MSYILDALKRADAERERGHVPGLHSQSRSALTPAPASPRRQTPGLALMAGVSALLLVAAAAWWWLSSPAVQQAPPIVLLAPVPTSPPPPPPAVPAAVVADIPAPPAPALPILAPAPLAVPAPASRPEAPGFAATAPPVTSTGPATPAIPAAGAQANDSKPRSFAELPPETRAQLPQVSVSGSTYSSNPAHRVLIANGKVVQEGEEIAPGLQLESIGPRNAVLNHRGMRYSIGY